MNVRLNASTGPNEKVEEAADVGREVSVEEPEVESERMDDVADVERDDVSVRDQAPDTPTQPRVVPGVVARAEASACVRAAHPADDEQIATA